MLGGRGEPELDGLKRPIFGGDEIAKHGDTEPRLRVTEFELGVKGGVWRDVGDQDPLIVLVGMPGLRRRRGWIRNRLPAAVVLISVEFQGSGNCGEIAFGIDDVKWPQIPEGSISARRFPCRFGKFAGLELCEMRRRISSLQERWFRIDFLHGDFVGSLLRLSDVCRAVGHQLNGDDESNHGGDDQQHAGRDFTLAELEGNETRRKQHGDTPAKRRKNGKPARCTDDFHSNPRFSCQGPGCHLGDARLSC